jgi:hypothetical protein
VLKLSARAHFGVNCSLAGPGQKVNTVCQGMVRGVSTVCQGRSDKTPKSVRLALDVDYVVDEPPPVLILLPLVVLSLWNSFAHPLPKIPGQVGCQNRLGWVIGLGPWKQALTVACTVCALTN